MFKQVCFQMMLEPRQRSVRCSQSSW